MARRRTNIRITRDLVLFVFGLAGVTYETVIVHVDRPSLLFLFGACIGLPAFLRSDEKKAPTPPPPPPPPPEPTPTPEPPTPRPRKRPPAKKAAPVKKATKKGTTRR